MPQLIGAIFAIIVAAYVVAAVVWAIQWIGALLLWVYQAFLLPLFIYYMPAILLILAVGGGTIGGYAAGRNYLNALRAQTTPEDGAGRLFKNMMTTLSFASLGSLALAVAVVAIPVFTHLTLGFVDHVYSHYHSIRLPGYSIRFPFWN